MDVVWFWEGPPGRRRQVWYVWEAGQVISQGFCTPLDARLRREAIRRMRGDGLRRVARPVQRPSRTADQESPAEGTGMSP